jgi:hypothetical protein
MESSFDIPKTNAENFEWVDTIRELRTAAGEDPRNTSTSA